MCVLCPFYFSQVTYLNCLYGVSRVEERGIANAPKSILPHGLVHYPPWPSLSHTLQHALRLISHMSFTPFTRPACFTLPAQAGHIAGAVNIPEIGFITPSTVNQTLGQLPKNKVIRVPQCVSVAQSSRDLSRGGPGLFLCLSWGTCGYVCAWMWMQWRCEVLMNFFLIDGIPPPPWSKDPAVLLPSWDHLVHCSERHCLLGAVWSIDRDRCTAVRSKWVACCRYWTFIWQCMHACVGGYAQHSIWGILMSELSSRFEEDWVHIISPFMHACLFESPLITHPSVLSLLQVTHSRDVDNIYLWRNSTVRRKQDWIWGIIVESNGETYHFALFYT